MTDQSHLDKKYFIDQHVYNCPFCNRRNVKYSLDNYFSFDWSNNKSCYIYLIECESCGKTSMHLGNTLIAIERYGTYYFKENTDIDSIIFYSVPTSFFVIDNRIPSVIRELISEAEGSLKMNYLTGASSCMRKAIYELLVIEKIEGDHYENRIKALKKKYPNTDTELFDILGHIQDMTSDKIHEQSWDEWDSSALTLIIETLKQILYEIYVFPKEKESRYASITKLREKVKGFSKAKNEKNQKEES